MAISNQNGAVTATAEYDPWGRMLASHNMDTEDYGFVGAYGVRSLATFNSKYVMGVRMYDAEVGRFLSEDAIGLQCGDTNLYRYVRNNPINMIDPSGFKTCTPRSAPVFTHLTYYTNKGISGITKSGYPAGNNTVAVDPSEYLLKWKNRKLFAAQGCKWNEFDIPGAGHRIALDTGSAVHNRIDVWFKTDEEGKMFLKMINPTLKPNGEFAFVTVYDCEE